GGGGGGGEGRVGGWEGGRVAAGALNGAGADHGRHRLCRIVPGPPRAVRPRRRVLRRGVRQRAAARPPERVRRQRRLSLRDDERFPYELVDGDELLGGPGGPHASLDAGVRRSGLRDTRDRPTDAVLITNGAPGLRRFKGPLHHGVALSELPNDRILSLDFGRQRIADANGHNPVSPDRSILATSERSEGSRDRKPIGCPPALDLEITDRAVRERL